MVSKDMCIPVFIAALFTIARTWKQPRCPSTEEWIKMWHIYIYIYTHTHTHTHTHTGIFDTKKKRYDAICSNMAGPRDHHTK